MFCLIANPRRWRKYCSTLVKDMSTLSYSNPIKISDWLEFQNAIWENGKAFAEKDYVVSVCMNECVFLCYDRKCNQ